MLHSGSFLHKKFQEFLKKWEMFRNLSNLPIILQELYTVYTCRMAAIYKPGKYFRFTLHNFSAQGIVNISRVPDFSANVCMLSIHKGEFVKTNL